MSGRQPTMQRKIGALCWHLVLEGGRTLCHERADAWAQSTTREPLDLSLRLCARCRAAWVRLKARPFCPQCGWRYAVHRGIWGEVQCNHCGWPMAEPAPALEG